ncbi:MAG: type IV secretory system conjugative DNA transfer family protein [Bacteroidetes bacterium]|nr:type IV secretory system conjugative DNA transfer family protein [Bacteroidota bacterium]
MAKPQGYGAPKFNRKPLRLLTILLCVGVYPILTMQLLAWQWGPPATAPWVEAGEWSNAAIGILILATLLQCSYSWRRCAVFLAPLGILLFTTPIYSPVTLIKIMLTPGYTQYVSAGVAAVMCVLWGSGLILGVRAKKGSVKGTADWGKAKALRQAEKGFVLGRWNTVFGWLYTVHGQLLRYGGDGHLMTIAATRSGKGVGSIIPNLLDHPGSLVCTDPKGENFFVTSAHRKKIRPGHKVIALDPFGITGETDGGYNPMDMINLSDPGAEEIALSMAENMIGPADKGEAFWVAEAKAVLATLILYAKTSEDPKDHNLGHVRALASMELPEFMEMCEYMSKEKRKDYPFIAQGATRILQKEPKELSGVMGTLHSRTHAFSSPRLQATLAKTTFSKEDLLGDNVSVYIIVPREHLVAYASWIRTTLTSIYGLITRDAQKREVKPQHRILFMLDEFANLGKIPEILDAVSLGAGFGISFWFILQDLAQLQHHYDKSWHTFVANSDVIQVFGIQDAESCSQVKKLMGETTVWKRKLTRSKDDPAVHREYDEDERPLMTQDEIRRLHPDRQIIISRPHLPVVANKIKFYADPAFKDLASPNPYVS